VTETLEQAHFVLINVHLFDMSSAVSFGKVGKFSIWRVVTPVLICERY